MADKIGPKEMRLRDLARRTREGKNLRASGGDFYSRLVDDLRKGVTKAAPKKKRKKRAKKKGGRAAT